ncbi:hypothetical protein SISSUDRAFT_402358 [Sistotremastrum suecicum HHB10207 ss-3]|uniref:F-box domain-containing protein n=1 Tax=Sistotremastrum suecicum HHB10207 ss-3 TaxID=1314776 RepID=A0A166FST4_9AGAM|nr:hypothetical protein SISSUDRAFT_402358 [Sistotremastrum suecicum HHB10207 ss-3]
MDGLCRNIKVLQKFLRILAPLTLNQNGEYIFSRDPTLEDWDRFSRASQRVRSLTYNPQGPNPYIADSAWQQFITASSSLPSQSPLFPRLTEIHWSNRRRPPQTIHSLFFMSDGLRILNLDAWNWDDTSTMLSGIMLRAPNLSVLRVAGIWTSPERRISDDVEERLIECIQHLEHLDSVALPVELLSSRAFLTLADKPFLSKIFQTTGPVAIDYALHKHLLLIQPYAFRSLLKLNLGMPLETLTKSLAESAGVLNIDSFIINIPSFLPNANPRLCFSLIAHTFPRLKELVLRASPKMRLRIDVAVLRPLFSLSALRHVHFDYQDLPDGFCDQDMFEIATSWTKLEVLYFSWSKSRVQPDSGMRLTIAALAPFAENCAHMRNLSLAVNASLPPALPPSADARFGRRFRCWEIATFISQIFSLSGTFTWVPSQVGQGPWQSRWAELKSELDNLRRMQSLPL